MRASHTLASDVDLELRAVNRALELSLGLESEAAL